MILGLFVFSWQKRSNINNVMQASCLYQGCYQYYILLEAFFFQASFLLFYNRFGKIGRTWPLESIENCNYFLRGEKVKTRVKILASAEQRIAHVCHFMRCRPMTSAQNIDKLHSWKCNLSCHEDKRSCLCTVGPRT